MTEAPSKNGIHPFCLKLSPEFLPLQRKIKKNTSHSKSHCDNKLFSRRQNHSKGLFSILIVLIIGSVFLGGCAVSYIDSHGIKHVIGFADVSFDTNSDSNGDHSQMIGITNIGFLVSRDPIQSGFSIGYNREAIIVLKDDSCTRINPGSLSWIHNLLAVPTAVKQERVEQ
jgi:hypothetical protein